MRVLSTWVLCAGLLVSSTGRADEDSEFDVSGVGQKVEHACTAAQPAVSVNGSGNQVTLTGECQRVEITGSNNLVTMEAVGRISVNGSANRATYVRGLGKKAPKIERTGVGNSVTKVK